MPNPAYRQAGVIQTIYDIVKAHGGVPITIGIKVETLSADSSMRNEVKTEAAALGGKEGEESMLSIQIPIARILSLIGLFIKLLNIPDSSDPVVPAIPT